MAVPITPDDFTIEARVESNGQHDSPKPATPKRFRRLRPRSSRSKQLGTPKKLPIGEFTTAPSPKRLGSASQESTEVVDLGSLAMDIGKAIGDSISDSMCSSISQFTQDILQKSSPDMGGQGEQSSDKGDKQEVVPAVQAEDSQPKTEVSDQGKLTSGKDASKSAAKAKRKEGPTVGSEPAKKRKVTDVEPEAGSTHADSDMSEAEGGKDTDSAEESDEWSPTKETDSFVELVFRKEVTKAQKD
jgi:hypothetical protein